MTHASEWIVIGLLRASAGLSLAALAVAVCVRLMRLRSPQTEQWAWLLVLVQGVILVPVAIPIPGEFAGLGASSRHAQPDGIAVDATEMPAAAGGQIVPAGGRGEPAPLPETIATPGSERALLRPAAALLRSTATILPRRWSALAADACGRAQMTSLPLWSRSCSDISSTSGNRSTLCPVRNRFYPVRPRRKRLNRPNGCSGPSTSNFIN